MIRHTPVSRRGGSVFEIFLMTAVLMAVIAITWKIAMRVIHVVDQNKAVTEMAKFNEAIDNFCLRFGEMPPDFHDSQMVIAFLKRRFPQCPPKKYPDFFNKSPASALCFWLGGPRGLGFSADPTNPFDTTNKRRIGPFFKFDVKRLREVDGELQYFPVRHGEDGEPYVYFCGGPKGYDNHPGWNALKPYRDSRSGKWVNPNTYQLFCPGADGKFGSGRLYPKGGDYDEFNYDDLANFGEGNNMRQSMKDYEREQLAKTEKAAKTRKPSSVANAP